MLSEGNFRPTLLVGVGGTGSKIAERILAMAIENDSSIRGRVGILALDTDANDIQKLRNIPKRGQIQFSQPETVYRLLERNASVENDWCYGRTAKEMSQTILGMTLIEGAGQIRMLTRLALHDAFMNHRLLEKFEAAINELSVHGEDQSYEGAIHILVVGSLAGATGSGSFAQVALALKQAARNRGTLATVRGVFLLPDVYVRSGALPVAQAPNVLANGYASLKELNAINVRALLQGRKTSFNFTYLPGHDLQAGATPFEAVTLIDYENSVGGSMGRNVDAYLEMAARSGYLMIFSPLGARYGSVTINDVRQKLAAVSAGSTNLYSGIGVAALSYPVDTVRRFLSRNLVMDNIKGDWLRLDQSYRDQMQRYRQQLEAGRTSVEEPLRDKTYIRDLEQLAREEPRTPFFRRCHDFLFPEIEDEKTHERTIRPRHVGWVEALHEYVQRSFWASDDTASVKKGADLDASSLEQSESLIDTVRRAEQELDRDLRILEAALQSRPDDIFYNALITADGLNGEMDQWAAHNIQSILYNKRAHPVAVRAFLYLARDALIARRDALNIADIKTKLFRCANVFRDEEEIQSTNNKPANRSTPRVMDRAREAGEGGILGRLFKSKLKAFTEEYCEYFNRSRKQMRDYADAVVAAKVCEHAIAELDALIRVFEGLFAEIASISEVLRIEIATLRKAHDTGERRDGNSFVYADSDCMDDAWDRLRSRAVGQKLDDQVNLQLISAVYQKHREDKRERRVSTFKQVNELFWSKVVEGFGQATVDNDHSEVFDLSVIAAMRRQFSVEDRKAAEAAAARGEPAPRSVQIEERMKRLIDRTGKQSVPYVSLRRPETDGTQIKFWTLHPRCEEDVANESLFSAMFRDQDGNRPIVEPDFSRYELICMNVRVNLELQHLTKLGLGDPNAGTIHADVEGRYAKAYSTMVERMQELARAGGYGAEFTPHIDQRWHVPGALPEIFTELEDRISGDHAKAFVVASVHGLIHAETEGNLRKARFLTKGYGLRNGVDEEIAESHDLWAIQSGFAEKGHLAKAALDFWDMVRESAAPSGLASHPSWIALTSPANLLRIVQPATARNREVAERDTAASNAVFGVVMLLDELMEAQDSALTEPARRQAVRIEANNAREAVLAHTRGEGFSTEIISVLDRLFRDGIDRALHR